MSRRSRLVYFPLAGPLLLGLLGLIVILTAIQQVDIGRSGQSPASDNGRLGHLPYLSPIPLDFVRYTY